MSWFNSIEVLSSRLPITQLVKTVQKFCYNSQYSFESVTSVETEIDTKLGFQIFLKKMLAKGTSECEFTVSLLFI